MMGTCNARPGPVTAPAGCLSTAARPGQHAALLRHGMLGRTSLRRVQQSAAALDAAGGSEPAPTETADSQPSTSEGDQQFAEGDVVVGRVVWATPKGAKVDLLDHPGISAYMPVREGPFAIRDAFEENLWINGSIQGPCLPTGLVREFRVIALPGAEARPTEGRSGSNERTKHGPLLSARGLDLDLLWRRANQLCKVSSQAKENFRVRVESANAGGLVSKLNGLSLFIPVSQLEKRPGGEWWTEQEMSAEYSGRYVDVACVEVVRSNRKVVCSLTKAKENEGVRAVEVGKLVWGTVRRVEPFGVFVGIEGTRTSGLLHISNVSRQHIETVNGVFSLGERVCCLVMGLDPDYSNISLSTAELEPEDGAVLRDKEAVWAGAEEAAAAFRAHLEGLEQGGFDFDAFYDAATANESRR